MKGGSTTHGLIPVLLTLTLCILAIPGQGQEADEATLRFEAIFESGEPFQGLDIKLSRERDEARIQNTTDADGLADFTLEAGEYPLNITYWNTELPPEFIQLDPPDLVTDDGTMILEAGASIDVTITLSDDVVLDTDSDGFYDWWETANGRDPLVDEGDSLGMGDGEEEGLPGDGTDQQPPDDGDEDEEDAAPAPWEDLRFMAVVAVIIVIVTAAGLGYSKLRRERLMEQGTRQSIYEYIKEKPGVHLRGIKKDLGLSMGVLNHHLRRLEDEEFIKSKQERQYRRFYPYYYSMADSPLLSPAQKTVYNLIVENPGISPTLAAKRLEKSRRNVYNHVNALEEMGVIRTKKEGKVLKCYVVEAG
jgi:predicted transcriptional regulator